MAKYIMALDQGTTSSRSAVFDKGGSIVSISGAELPQIYPAEGWVEHSPDEIWNTQLKTAIRAAGEAGGWANIAALGITNQRETLLVWDRETGRPVYPAIVWQCRRTAGFCAELKSRGYTDMIRKKTGLLTDAYFSAAKLKWILDNVAGAREGAEAGRLLFGTVDTWLMWKLSGGKIHATDYTNASRTMLFNINTLTWDDELLELFGVPRAMLPDVKPSDSLFGYTSPGVLGAEIPITGVAGDQQAALFGQCCFKPGQVKNTYGTGGFLLMNTGGQPRFSEGGLLTTLACGTGGRVQYALEGSVFICGAAVQWLRDGLGIIASAAESESLAAKVSDTCGVYFIPAFVGLGAPYWNPDARGAIVGLTRAANKHHIARATLEAIAYQIHDVIKVMQDESGIPLDDLRVDGGASANNLLMQFQSDILGARIRRPACLESTALGAAMLAGLTAGIYSGTDEIESLRRDDRIFEPVMSESERNQKLDGWRRAVGRVL